jgi:hypothetical protein
MKILDFQIKGTKKKKKNGKNYKDAEE